MPLFGKRQGNANAGKRKGKDSFSRTIAKQRFKGWLSASAWREWGKQKLQNNRIAKAIGQKRARIPQGSESIVGVLLNGKPPGFDKAQAQKAKRREIAGKPETAKTPQDTQVTPAELVVASIMRESRRASMQKAIEEKRQMIETIEKNKEGRTLQETEKKSLRELYRELQEGIRMLETMGTEKGKEFIPTLQELSKKIQRILSK